jgi:hypothetical protein
MILHLAYTSFQILVPVRRVAIDWLTFLNLHLRASFHVEVETLCRRRVEATARA